jgi:protein-L-isoaspartate(D-aspartate) O-methyltransferase
MMKSSLSWKNSWIHPRYGQKPIGNTEDRFPFLLPVPLLLGSLVFIVFSGICPGETDTENHFAVQRERMVRQQIERRGITNQRTLAALRKVERHRFVPPVYQSRAYGDYPLPIGSGQTISQPYVVAFMTELLNLDPSDRVLEVGTGSGYQAAVLAEICKEVYSIEIMESLGNAAAAQLKKQGYENVHIKIGDGYLGWKEHSPFDAIIVTCAPTRIPTPLKEQLAEGGRMIIPVGETGIQQLVLMVKKEGKLSEENVLPVRFVPMLKPDGTTY